MLSSARSRAASTIRAHAPTAHKYAPPEKFDGAERIDFDVPYELHKLETGPAPYTYASKEELVDYFTVMYRKRRFSIAID